MNFEFDPTITLSLAFNLSVVVFAWFRTRRSDVDEHFKTGSERMNRHENRISKLETEVLSMPGKDDIHAMQLEMVKMTGNLGEMRAVMEGNAKIMARLESIVSRHEDHLLDGAKK